MDQLTALHLLEEVTQQCRYDKPERTDELRQAMRVLLTPKTKPHLLTFWRILEDDTMHRFGKANHELMWIYQESGIERDDRVAQAIWKREFEARLTPEMRRARGG